LAVDGGTRREDEAEVLLASEFQEIEGCVGVCFVAGFGILDRFLDAHDGGLVEDDIDIVGE
jgi:hypothetical protein